MNRNKLAFWNIWSSYAISYFGKINLSIVIPALLASATGMGLYNVGLVASGFFFAYALGQFFHGQLSEKYNPFIYIAIGLIGSGILNLFLGFWGGFFWLLFIGEILDGFFQSMGWSSCVRANAVLQPKENIEKSTVILGTSYQIGNSLAWLVSAVVVGGWGWQAGFFVAAGFLIMRGILLLLTMPQFVVDVSPKISIKIKQTLCAPVILSGLSLCLLNMVRYGMIVWIPLYLYQSQALVVSEMFKLGLKVCLIPLAGVTGTLVYNKIKIKKELLTVIFLILLSVSFIVLLFTPGGSFLNIVLLLIGSFFLYSPHVFLVSTMPSRFLDKNIVAASTGFIDGMGYLGTFLVGLIVPFFLVTLSLSWVHVFVLWAILAVLVAILVAIIYSKYYKKSDFCTGFKK